MLRNILLSMLLAGIVVSCTETKKTVKQDLTGASLKPTNQVVLSSQIYWEKLNPARGEQSPQAGTVWGDRNGSVATGFLAKFVDGFSSPPHIHNVTYRAIVIKGMIHNDDPSAEKMWMPSGSFWTQPSGEVHITAAKGEENIAYVEIDSGPYLVRPIDEAFDTGSRPVNLDRDNIIWLDATKTKYIESSAEGQNAELAFLWEEGNTSGNLMKFPTGFTGEVVSHGNEFHAIIIEGLADYSMPDSKENRALDPGSYFTSRGTSRHQLSTGNGPETIIYVRTNDDFKIRPYN